ncbi:hypothetical protein Glove_149g31 [Diversispora epigaea]|uniref:Uncharacterized protein n=1 Tax=Diversispora epigaea TaxID=1348612 RepID=A0A397J3B0_9GLOM|nr:hypothetical protein Glove_149g32 [Diversispora epigaea]RHZ79370.1 hypothetical protein Glove_149g31 [Diversispora epigaea]
MALNDKDDFVVFFGKYKGLSKSQHMVIYVNINNNFKHKYKKNTSNNNDKTSSSDEEVQKSTSKKKVKKSRISKESQLSEIELE